MASTEGPSAEDRAGTGGDWWLEGMFQKLCNERWLCAGAGAAGERGWTEGAGDGVMEELASGGGEKTCWGCCGRC